MAEDPRHEAAPAGRLIGRRGAAPTKAWQGPDAGLTLLRALTLRTSLQTPGALTLGPLLSESGAGVDAVDQALASFDEDDALAARAAAVEVLDRFLRPSQVSALTLVQRREALARRARLRREQGQLSAAARDWTACSALDPEQLPAAVIPWVALDRIRGHDSSGPAIRFYRDHAEEIDRVIKERPKLDREGLFRSLVALCYGEGHDDDVIALVRRLVQLNRRSELNLVLAVRLFHAGASAEAAAALERASHDAAALRASERGAKLAMIHLYSGALALSRRDTESARLAFRKAMALEPRRLVAPLMAAELEGRLGDPSHTLLRRQALRLVDQVEGRARALAPEGYEEWLPDALARRCQWLRETLSKTGAP